jgi:hypothetical protein
MAHERSPLVALAQRGAEAANLVVAERSADNPRRKPSVYNRSNYQARRAQSDAASSAIGNCHLADNDARHRITKNHNMRETGHDCDDLRNVIEDRRCLRARSSTPLRRSLAKDDIPLGRGGFHALVAPLKDVRWPDKFRAGHIDKYVGSSNPKEFIQIYHTVIETA